jgi:hypothetical protein
MKAFRVTIRLFPTFPTFLRTWMRTMNLMNNSEKFRFNFNQNSCALQGNQRNAKAAKNPYVLNEMGIK